MEIKISKSARNCTGCQRPFEHEEQMNSLVRIQDQEFIREDYCSGCWVGDKQTGAYSVWTPKFFDPRVAEQQPPEVFSPLRQLFYEVADAEDRVGMAVAYLAAQLLRRQKVFRLIKESDAPEGEMRVALFADRLGDRLIEVRDPDLSHAEMEEGRRMLLERLNQLENPGAGEEPSENGKQQET